jgi:hypothetical protein
MASRSRTTFKKRQKELARLDKARDKAAKRVQRKMDKKMGVTHPDDDGIDMGEFADLDGVDAEGVDTEGEGTTEENSTEEQKVEQNVHTATTSSEMK